MSPFVGKDTPTRALGKPAAAPLSKPRQPRAKALGRASIGRPTAFKRSPDIPIASPLGPRHPEPGTGVTNLYPVSNF
ncbi:hypothetical protein PSEUDO8AS_20287 [Pseudomonas sp. 8AS]|nr:hypothetical protein PSEUDO8AS_20287 [Pseudomonas sp. 8AS]